MAPDSTPDLRRTGDDRRAQLDALIPLVYDELRRLAHAQLAQERPGHTLSTTGLVHEAYLRLAQAEGFGAHDRTRFLAVAARVMRHVLIDFARARKRAKRGAGAVAVPLELAAGVHAAHDDALIALDEALSRLERENERHCRVVEYRCFGGLSIEETAAALNVSMATVKRDWAFCRAWLNRELSERQVKLQV